MKLGNSACNFLCKSNIVIVFLISAASSEVIRRASPLLEFVSDTSTRHCLHVFITCNSDSRILFFFLRSSNDLPRTYVVKLLVCTGLVYSINCIFESTRPNQARETTQGAVRFQSNRKLVRIFFSLFSSLPIARRVLFSQRVR